MRAMLAGTAWLMLGAVALADTTGDLRLDAFRDVCVPERHDHAAAQALTAKTWASVSEDADATLARVMDMARKGMTPEPGEKLTGKALPYRREVDGKPLFLVLTNVKSDQVEINGCFLYDFQATAQLDPALITAWLKEEPAEKVDEAGVIQGQTWNAAAIEGVMDLRSGFIPVGSAAAAVTGFTGMALALSASADPSKASK